LNDLLMVYGPLSLIVTVIIDGDRGIQKQRLAAVRVSVILADVVVAVASKSEIA